MLSDATLELGGAAASALLGLDRLYRRESGDENGLAVLNLDRAGAIVAEDFSGYAAARNRFRALERQAASLPEADRREYYRDTCRSTLAFITWRTEGLAFTEQLARFLHVPAEPASDRELDQLRRELCTALTQLGYDGALGAQCAAWEARHRVAPPDVPAVLSRYLNDAWDRTEQHLTSIPAAKADGMKVSTVSGVAFNARCNYLERTIELNTDPILTGPGLKHLAVHEGYPGHYLQFKLRQVGFAQGTSPADGLLSCVNTASSSVFEGIADAGMETANWIDSDDDRVQALLTRYRSGIGTGAAWRLHALGWSESQVADWLRGVSLTGGEGWVANRLAFLRAPARAVLIWSYWWGEPTVAAAWRRVPLGRRREFVDFLYGRMHSIGSVGRWQ